jgi:hypothetical protein
MAAEIAAALGGRREGRQWRCRCPIHGGRSLLVRDGDAGRILVFCHGGCEARDVLAELRRSVRGLANKLPEHAARLAAILALVDDLGAPEIGANHIRTGIALAEHYATEALRLFGASRVAGKTRCRMHGGAAGSGAPKGKRNGKYRHGGFTTYRFAETPRRNMFFFGPSRARTRIGI